jgi:DNA-binding CsgD family transcriptional regulator
VWVAECCTDTEAVVSRDFSRTPFVGRQRELGRLLERLEAAGRDEGGVVLVAGEPGIGKSRLLAELAERARTDGWQVLAGRAYETEGMPPYLPFTEALRAYVRACPDDVLRAQLGRGAAGVALLVPELRERLPDLPPSPAISPEQERYRLFEGVADFLLAVVTPSPNPSPSAEPRERGVTVNEHLPLSAGAAGGEGAGGRGALLLLDDLHWADKPSLLLLLHLARRLAGAPLLVAGAYRTVDLSRSHPLQNVLADLAREGLSERVLLTSLTPEEVRELVRELAGAPPAAAVAEAITRETEGNPFFVREVVRHLLAEGRDLADPQAVPARWGIPEGVRQVIGKRLARLSAETNQMLQAAAVLGDGFTFDVLQAAGGLAFAPLMDALEEAVAAGMLREEAGGYQFTHALIRQTLYDGLSLARRQWLHLRAGEALQQTRGGERPERLGALAAHYRLAGAAADPEKALIYAQRAAEAAQATFAWEDAAAHWLAALDLLTEQGTANDGQRYELFLALGTAQRRAGDLVRAMASFEQAAAIGRTQGQPDWLASAALGMEDARWAAGVREKRVVGVLADALAALDESDCTLRARVMARLAMLMDTVDGPAARVRIRQLSDDAVRMARQLGDPATLAVVLHARLETWCLGDTLDAAGQLGMATELLRAAQLAGESDLVHRGNHHRTVWLLRLGDIPALVRHPGEAGQLMQQPWDRAFIALNASLHALLAGRFAEAEQFSREGLTLGRRVGSQEAVVRAQDQIFVVLRAQGRLAELELDLQAELRARTEQLPATSAGPRVRLAVLYSELGRLTEARTAFERVAGHDFADLPPSTWLETLSRLAELCTVLGDTRRALSLYDILVPFAAHHVTTGAAVYVGPVAHYLGLLATVLARWDAAERHFRQALDINTRNGLAFFVAQTQGAYATMLLARRQPGDSARARALLEEARATYTDLGLDHWAAKTQAALADPRLPSETVGRPTFPNGLSEREVQVLRLIAAGKSNKEIAEALVISLNTVFRHVTHIFQKTGAANRAESATYAARHRLLDQP